jgi:hypothetical protein
VYWVNLAAACALSACLHHAVYNYNTHVDGPIPAVLVGWVRHRAGCATTTLNHAVAALLVCWHRTEIHLHYMWLFSLHCYDKLHLHYPGAVPLCVWRGEIACHV